jgi:type IV pilus assembly protein PilE
MRYKQRGVTLIELIIVIVIIAILAAVAVPSYRQYVLRSQRTDATEALLRLATAQEKFYLQNNRYALEAERAAAPPGGLGIAGTEHGWYALSVTAPANLAASADGFTVRATTVNPGPQASDAKCVVFQVTDRGVKTAQRSGGADNTAECWR